MPSTIADATLDHVAVAVEAWSDAWPSYAVALGGAWSSGGLNVGFGPAQLRFSNGGRVEILQPWRSEDNPFLRRFLDRHGPGPHHLTYKVPDLASALDDARAAGFSPVGVDLTNADWKEAFLHPRQATGIVVQLAQATYAWESPPPEGFPTNRREPAASLERVTHAVADIDDALALFEGLLGGRRTARGTAPDHSWEYADVEWPGPPRLRLVSPTSDAEGPGTRADTPLGAWLGHLPGRVHHLAFSIPGPHATDAFGDHAEDARRAQVPGLGPEDASARVIEPRNNLGTRLVLLDDARQRGT
ncbi:MAG TPA: VOC family protein [Acidimicrobiales bacterium]|jgi:catechol 2,3-dioxygenase-like lactoylglutathione lyase family enzyme